MTQMPLQSDPMDLKDFFSAAEARTDRWRQLAAAGRSWEAAVGRGESDERVSGGAGRLLADLAALEAYWAYPGARLMATVGEALTERNAGIFARLVQKISTALLTGAYRHDAASWDPLDEREGRLAELLPPDVHPGHAAKPYFH